MVNPQVRGGFSLERVTGIEPALSAWEADVLPLNYTRVIGNSPPTGPLYRRRSRPDHLHTGLEASLAEPAVTASLEDLHAVLPAVLGGVHGGVRLV